MDVIWYDASRGNWDAGLLMSIFDRHNYVFRQHNTKEEVVFNRAIIILVGKPDVKAVRNYLEKFKEALVILTSDEDSFFDWKAAIPERHEVWTQYYAPNKSEIKTRLLLGAPSRIKDYQTSPLEKKYLWSFVGQVQNPHRQKCVEVLQKLLDEGSNGYLKTVEGFSGSLGGEVEYQDYLDIMRQSKFVICPSGSMCADTFRFYEAMECGALPITEARSPRDNKNFNYWFSVLSPRSEVIDLDEWGQLNAYFEFYFGATQAGYYTNDNEWWNNYKIDLAQKLIDYATQ